MSQKVECGSKKGVRIPQLAKQPDQSTPGRNGIVALTVAILKYILPRWGEGCLHRNLQEACSHTHARAEENGTKSSKVIKGDNTKLASKCE